MTSFLKTWIALMTIVTGCVVALAGVVYLLTFLAGISSWLVPVGVLLMVTAVIAAAITSDDQGGY